MQGLRLLTSLHSLSPTSPLSSKPITLTASDTLKVALTATEGKTGKRPHQAFLTFTEQSTGLEESFAFNVRDNGKGKLDVVSERGTHKLDGI